MTAKKFLPALVVAGLLGGTAISQAQIICTIPCPVFDFLAEAQHVIVAVTTETTNVVKELQAEALYKMGLRLSYWTTLKKYVIDRDFMPEWKIHNYFTDDVLFAKPFNFALSYGDKAGDGYDAVTIPRASPTAALADLPPDAAASLRSNLALLDLADSAIIRATDTTGKLRFNGRDEADSLIAMQDDVTDDDKEQSLAAVLDKVSGAALVQAHNRQTQNEFKAAILEQLLVEQAWDRNTDAATMNMILAHLKAAQDAEGQTPATVDGADQALRHWQLP